MSEGFADAREILDRMEHTTSGIRAVLTDLESTVERDLTGWPPGARARYRAAKREWTVALERMPRCVERARDAFQEISGSCAREP